jgi:type III secretion protein V
MRRGEIVFSLIILLLIAGLALPVPPFFLDFLLSANLLFSLILLFTTLSVVDPIKLSTLPMLLLMATLFRLSLNIATTRSILSSGSGGQLVELFGRLVISENLVVGTVIFFIITLVQFVVVAKGGERVAEVSARFALDALPGKQMSIDADVRSGLIDFETARNRRQEVQLESRLYGALDGAMKFVKGDAIAGIVIALINAGGGIAIGVGREGLSITQSLHKYTLLSVGDGLLSQIPSFLNALAAGLIVTRVGRETGRSSIREMVIQIVQCNSLLMIVGIFSCIAAFLPGVPLYPFFGFGMLLTIGGGISSRTVNRQQNNSNNHFRPSPPPLITLTVLKERYSDPQRGMELVRMVERNRERLYAQTGLIIPPCEIRWGEAEGMLISIRGTVRETLHSGSDSEIEDQFFNALWKVRVELVDNIMIRRLLDFCDARAPELVAHVIPTVISVTQLTVLARSLLEEGIAVLNFETILQAVAESEGRGLTARNLLEEARIALRRQIQSLAAKKLAEQCSVLTLDPLLDVACAQAEREGKLLSDGVVNTLLSFFEKYRDTDVLVVVSRGARALIKDYLRIQGLLFSVVAFEELEALKFNAAEECKIEKNENFLESLAA